MQLIEWSHYYGLVQLRQQSLEHSQQNWRRDVFESPVAGFQSTALKHRLLDCRFLSLYILTAPGLRRPNWEKLLALFQTAL